MSVNNWSKKFAFASVFLLPRSHTPWVDANRHDDHWQRLCLDLALSIQLCTKEATRIVGKQLVDSQRREHTSVSVIRCEPIFGKKSNDCVFTSSVLVVRNSIDTFCYRWVSIPSLGVDTWYCQWNSDQKWKKKSKMGTTGKWGKCRRNLEKLKFESRNLWLTCGWECSWWRFSEGSLSINTIDTFAKVLILYRYRFSSILRNTNQYSPGLAPYDFFLFEKLKDFTWRTHFGNVEAVKAILESDRKKNVLQAGKDNWRTSALQCRRNILKGTKLFYLKVE